MYHTLGRRVNSIESHCSAVVLSLRYQTHVWSVCPYTGSMMRRQVYVLLTVRGLRSCGGSVADITHPAPYSTESRLFESQVHFEHTVFHHFRDYSAGNRVLKRSPVLVTSLIGYVR